MRHIILSAVCILSISAIAQTNKCYIRPVESLNTENNEFNVALSPSNEKLTYSEQKIYKHGDSKDRVMIATHTEDGWRSEGKILELHKKVSHIDVLAWPSEDTVYVYKGRHHGKIYIYVYNSDKAKWKKQGKMKICKRRIRGCSLDESGNTLYFSMNYRKTGVGGNDIYMCKRLSDVKWASPVNIGFEVNSKANEIAPVIIGDSMIVFTSDRDGGFGGYDLYCTKLDSGKWGKPVNLGEPLNSNKDDAFYALTNKDRNVFISSNRDGGKGGMDLYYVTYITPKKLIDRLPESQSLITDRLLSDISMGAEKHIDSTKITLVKGVIMGDDSVYLKARVDLSDNGLMQVIATQEAEDNGVYEVILPGGANYGIAVSYPGYLFHSENFDLPEQNEYREINKDIVLKKIAIGKNVALRNIFFETDKSELSQQSKVELGNVIKLLNENPTLHIELGGHTDNTGSKAHNQKLSEARAQAVVDYLVEHGIAAERLTSKGYGFSQPVADNKTPEGRAENRRTEILVTKI